MSLKRRALGRGLSALIPASAPPPPSPSPPGSGSPGVAAPEIAPASATNGGTTVAAASFTASAGASVPAAPAVMPAPLAIPGARALPQTGLRTVGIEEVHPARDQPRKTFNDARLDELASSIKAQGVIQPLVVRLREAGGYEIVAGERRWRAAQRAGLHSVPVVVRDTAPERAFELAMVENLQREDLNPIEEAEGFDRLIREFGYTQETLATRVGKDRTTVTNALRLLKLPDEVRGMVISGELAMGHARALLGLEAPGKVATDVARQIERTARKVVARQMSVRQVEALVRRERDTDAEGSGGANAPAAPTGPTTSARDLSARLARVLATRVRVVERGPGEGHIEIHYGSLDQLDDLIARLLGADRD